MKLSKILLLLAIAAMTSCTIVDLEDPLKGNITLTTDWGKRTSGIEQPTNYTVIVNNQTLNYTQPTNLLPELNTGTYPIHIYNTPDKISIAGTTATVATTNNQVEPLPGWLFTATTQAIYADFKEETVTAVMQQQIRQLTIELSVAEGDPERIASTAATLTGIANSLDFKSNVHSGTNLSVAPVFVRNGNKLTAAVHLIGTTSESQKLILDIAFTDGRTQRIESDVSSMLANFNTNKHIPINISADLNTPAEAGFAATITGWISGGNGSGTAW